ncbi:MAG: hypothetical protein KAG61_03410 [Bacteriovoracaceae bacterium]|nr:hypothetical protein [Bacteriovoracaceae bacterium]
MKNFILPLILLMALAVNQFTTSNNSPTRSIASVETEEASEAPILNTVGDDCVECRLAALQIQNLYQMIEVFAMNQVVLSQLASPKYDPNASSIMEQMGNYTDQLYASNPLVTGRINDYAMERDASTHNTLPLYQGIQGYGFNYDSYLGNSSSVQSVQQAGFNFSAPPMDIDPTYRRMSQFGGFQFGNQVDRLPKMPEVLLTDSFNAYPSEFI